MSIKKIRKMASTELTEWMAYSRIEGLEEIDSWDQTARLANIFVQLMADEKSARKYTEADFKPQRIVEAPKPQSVEYMKMMFGGLAAAINKNKEEGK